MDTGLRSTGEHDVRVPELDEARGVTYCVGTRGTGRGGGVGGSAEAVPHGDVSGRHVDQESRHEQGGDLLEAPGVKGDGGVVDVVKVADAGTETDPGAFLVLVRRGQPARVGECFLRGTDGKLRERSHVAGLSSAQDTLRVPETL